MDVLERSGCGTETRGLVVDLAVLDEQLAFMILTVFSNLNDSTILCHDKVGSNDYNGKGRSAMVIAKLHPCFRWPLLTSNLC